MNNVMKNVTVRMSQEMIDGLKMYRQYTGAKESFSESVRQFVIEGINAQLHRDEPGVYTMRDVILLGLQAGCRG